MTTTTVPCPACQHPVKVRLEARAKDDRRPVESATVAPPPAGESVGGGTRRAFAQVDAGFSAVRHWLFAVLALLTWSAAGHAASGIAIVGVLWLLAEGALRLVVPSAAADAGDGARARAAQRPGVLTAAFALGAAVGVLAHGPGWWVLGAAVLVVGAAFELRDVTRALRPGR